MSKAKLLIIDDEKDLVETLTFRLETNGYEVIKSYDGQDGLDKAKKEKPDLMILDLTARAQESDKEMGKEVGANAYLTKPFEPEILLLKIKELLA